MSHPGNWSERKIALERERLTRGPKPLEEARGSDEFTAYHLVFWGQRLIAICCACRRAVDIEVKPLGAVGDVRRLRLRCIECGSRDVITGVRR